MCAAVVAGLIALALSGCSVVSFLSPVTDEERERISQAVVDLELGAELRGMVDNYDGFARSYTMTVVVQDSTEIDGAFLWQVLSAVLPAIEHPGIGRVKLSVETEGQSDVNLRPAILELRQTVDRPTWWWEVDDHETVRYFTTGVESGKALIEEMATVDG